tara:strand:+ start:11243 stop:12913 length:1671 start_codon:yes stop_codon:yes gene_type:complete
VKNKMSSNIYDILKKLNSIQPAEETSAPKQEAQKTRLAESMEQVVAGKVAEVAPPGAKAERMVKHIKQSYSKDGKFSPKEKAIAYATAWKAHKAGKVEEAAASIKTLLDSGMTAKQINEGWEDMLKAVKKKDKEEKGTGKYNKKAISTGTVYTRKYDADGMSNTDDEVKAAGEKRGRGRPKKSAFESTIDRLMAEAYGDHAYRPSGEEIAGPEKKTIGDKLKGMGRDLMNKIAPDDETLLKDLEKKTIGEEGDDMDVGGDATDDMMGDLNYDQDQLRQSIGDEMFAQVKSAVEQGMSLASTEMPDAMYDALYDYYTENGEMPYGTAKARDGDPADWIENKLDELFGDMSEGFNQDGSYNTSDDEAMEFDEFDADDNDLSEMMRLAGQQVKEAAKPDFLDIDKDGDTEEDMKKAAADKKAGPEKGVNPFAKKDVVEECGMEPSSMPMGELTISGSPEALAAMLKLAGMQVPAMMQQPMEEEKDPRYDASTTPDEQVMPVQVLTKGGNGEVAGMEKPMHKDGAARFSDNPLAMKEGIDDLSKMGRDMMKAYDSIKIQK